MNHWAVVRTKSKNGPDLLATVENTSNVAPVFRDPRSVRELPTDLSDILSQA